jgi:hypothetical protein
VICQVRELWSELTWERLQVLRNLRFDSTRFTFKWMGFGIFCHRAGTTPFSVFDQQPATKLLFLLAFAVCPILVGLVGGAFQIDSEKGSDYKDRKRRPKIEKETHKLLKKTSFENRIMSSITNAGATTPNHHDETRSSILQVLESNRLDLSRVQNLSQCLRQAVGKQRPAPVVKRLMQEHHSKITVEELQASHVKLLQADFWQAATATTGLYMQRISIVVWFVQYILESTHNSDKNAVPAVNKIVVALLNQMARAISSLVKGRNETGDIDEQKDDEDDNETLDASNFDPPTIAAFAIGVLLRGIQPYVSTRPILLSPLWKGICDLAGPMPRMSPELAEETLRALLTYLQEGKRQVSNSGTVSIQQQEFHIKLLVFLVARLMTLLPLYIRSQPNSSSDLLQDVLLNLCELRGIGMMSNSADSRYRSLEGKIDQCVVTAVFCAGKTWESRALEALLHTSRGDLSRTALSRSLGKALLLRGVLRHTVPREKLQARDAEMVLSICEDLVFVTLPLCRIHGGESVLQTRSSLLADVLDLIVASLLQIASSEDGSSTSSSASRQSTLEQLLIRWLAPTSEKRQTLHPMSRELAVSVVCMYVMLLCPNDDSRSDSPRSVDQVAPSDKPGGRSQNERAPSMIVMLAKMVFDPRTTCEHRRNLASVLLRLTNPHSSDRKQLGKMAANVVGIEFVKSWKEDCKAQRRKRKRTEKSNAVQASGFGALGVDDLLVMMEVLLNVGRLEKSILDEHLATFCHDLAQDNYTALDPKTSKGLAVCQQSPASLSLLLSAFGGVLRVSPEAFQDRLGQKPTRMSDALIAWLSERWKRLVKSKRSTEGSSG